MVVCFICFFFLHPPPTPDYLLDEGEYSPLLIHLRRAQQAKGSASTTQVLNYTKKQMMLSFFLEPCLATDVLEGANRRLCLLPTSSTSLPDTNRHRFYPPYTQPAKRVCKQTASCILWSDRVSSQHKPTDNNIQTSSFLD